MIFDALNKFPSLTSTDTQMLLMEKYETKFNIHNHDLDTNDRPFALVAMHDCEDVSLGSLLYEDVVSFADNRVYKFFNISIKDFLDMPPYVCKMLIDISKVLSNKENTEAANVLNNIGNPKKK